MRYIFLSILLLWGSTSKVSATQLVTAKASRQQLYWGVPFTIDLVVAPTEALADFEVAPTYPPGFQVDPLSPSIPSSLSAGSTYTVKYKITPPDHGYATTETYSIGFNVGYNRAADGAGNRKEARTTLREPKLWQSVEISFTGTFRRRAFYFWTMTGLLIGWLIKALSSFARTLASSPTGETDANKNPSFLTWQQATSALTSLATGFLVMLLLSRHELPTGAIHDSLALGIGLGFLSDDQLLNRLRGLSS